ncbi:amidase [Caballeronia sp. LZ065]|uniref:amidase n=1 Tax=Caballeronia sp. LZ065 TaxID=3038571 RepID=UPI0028546249|nr:amidase [Caballeronia sp. LZ065]MDR5781144.1 amidase [Caballeronia sp. LZ065]
MSRPADADLPFLSIVELARHIASREISSAEVTALMLDRIAALDPSLNAFITVVADAALTRAKSLDALLASGVRVGPLHGVPIAVKDNIATAGIRTTGASKIFADWIPEQDATVVQRLHDAGAVLLGKLNLYELAFGGVHPDFGETRNPWDLARACGASSSGPAAAVAAGLAFGSLGTDTGGSIRLPAAACGLVGLKPTYGIVSRAGVLAAGYSLDHIGPLTRTVTDCALMLQTLAGHDPRDPAGSQRAAPNFLDGIEDGIDGVRIGVPRVQPSEAIEPEVQQACAMAIQTLERAGARLIDVTLPDHLLSRNVMWAIAATELAEAHRDHLRNTPEAYSERVRDSILQGALLPATEYVHAQRVRQKIALAYARVMDDVDLLAMPVMPFPAWPVGAAEVSFGGSTENLMAALTRYCPPFNMTGQPAIAIPTGFDAHDLPLSMQIAGRLHEDRLVLRAARAHERATDWHRRRPTFC